MINSGNTSDYVMAKIYVSSMADVAGQNVQITASAPDIHNTNLVQSSAKAKAETATKWMVKILPSAWPMTAVRKPLPAPP